MKENVRNQIVEARKKRDLAWQMTDEAQAFLDKQEEVLEKAFQKLWDKTFPGVSVYFLVSRSEVFYLYDIGKVVPLADGRWAKQDGHEYHEHNTKFVDCPVSIEQLKKFMIEIEQETSLRVELDAKELKTKDTVERLSTIDDLQCKFGPFTLLEEGEIWYVGWDIPDNFAVGQFPDGHIEVWYSTNGHGFGFDVVITRGETEELERFFECVASNKVSISTTKGQVQKSWET